MFQCNHWSRQLAYAQGYAHGHQRPFYETRGTRHGGFGVRRPLRYLSYHLDLDASQRRKVAASFERVKLAREQAKLDRKKCDGNVTDVFLREDVAREDLHKALEQRTQIEQNMQDVIATELYEIASVLDDEQREEFAHLLRTGVLRL